MGILGIVVAVSLGIWLSIYVPISQHQQPSGCNPPPNYMVIIADERGYNNSVSVLAANPSALWPVIKVQTGTEVKIYVCNQDTVASHGFAIEHYMPAGVALAPGESFIANFIADTPGNFLIYCTIFCPVHAPWMIRGLLTVH